MNPNELRLGNWVDPTFHMQVVAIYKDEILCNFEGNQGDPWDYHPKDLEPIPLTVQLLIDLGFKKSTPGGSIYELGDFHIQDFGPLGFFECMNHLKIDFVHRLQNVYFELKGKEL